MPDARDPWRREREPQGGGFNLRPLIWLALVVLVGFTLWHLDELFPGRLSSGESQGRLLQLLTVLALVAAALFSARRRIRLAPALRNIAIWCALALVLALGYAFQDELGLAYRRLRAELLPGYAVSADARALSVTQSNDGHFHITGMVGDVRIGFLIDTGASSIVLSPDDAARLGIDPARLSYSRAVDTANGIGHAAPYRLAHLTVGPIELSDVPVLINQAEMDGSLLGMSFLSRLASVEIEGRRLTLRWH